MFQSYQSNGNALPVKAEVRRFPISFGPRRKNKAKIEVFRLVSQDQTRSFQPALESLPYGIFKTAFDIVGASVLLVAASPVMFLVSLAIKCTSKGPAIFCQKRLTKGGKIFTIYKFRTMDIDAETGSGAVWAKEKDPRVTKVGAFLRTTRLDELPQLFNVLRGEMSLIGPRPERPEFFDELTKKIPGFHRRLAVRAGLTGLAQVGNGYSSSIDGHRKKLAWDRLYIQRRSVPLELWISVKTIAVILTGRGAM